MMEEKWEQAVKILKEQKQEQLLNYNIKNKEELAEEILNINFEQLNKLYKKTVKKENSIIQEIEPISYIEKANLSESEKKKYKEKGEALIKQGQYAVVTMAGGQRN